MVIKEAQKREALERLKILKVHENVLSDFKDGVIRALQAASAVCEEARRNRLRYDEYHRRNGNSVEEAAGYLVQAEVRPGF